MTTGFPKYQSAGPTIEPWHLEKMPVLFLQIFSSFKANVVVASVTTLPFAEWNKDLPKVRLNSEYNNSTKAR